MGRIGITVKDGIGVGDKLQFSSLPENYFRATGEKLVDVSRPWIFDHNPYVIREPSARCDAIVEMWNFPKRWEWPVPRREDKPKVYLANAEIFSSLFSVPMVLNRPRLYQFEDFPFEQRRLILLQVVGKSHGELPRPVVEFIVNKYGPTGQLRLVGPEDPWGFGIPRIETPTLWDLAEVISKARMFIGPDSGPSWVAACYPDVVTKVIRIKPSLDVLSAWVPLEIQNVHSHWDDRARLVYNVTEQDVGFSWSYKRI